MIRRMVTTSGEPEAPNLTPQRAAAMLGVSAAAVSDWADRGYLPYFRTPSGQRRFRRSDVEALLARMKAEAEAS
jgi:excisionase family DNA binding protein